MTAVWATGRWVALGAVMALAHAPFNLHGLLILGLALALAWSAPLAAPRRAAWAGWLLGVGYFGVSLCWIVEPLLVDAATHGWMAPFALGLMAGGMALFWAAAFWAGARFGRGAVFATALALALSEAARAWILTGFPWADIAQGMMDTPVAWLLPVLGPRGVAAVVLAGAAALAWRWDRMWPVAIGLAALVQFAPGPGGVSPQPDAPMVRMIQPNAPQEQKWDPDYIPVFYERQLAFTAAAPAVDLVVWPEMSLASMLSAAQDEFDQISDAARGAAVILGLPRLEGGRYYNSLVMIEPGGRLAARYDKTHLVPFGEYMPFGDVLARLGIFGLAAGGGGFAPGDTPPMVVTDALGALRPLICYEAIFAEEVRRMPTRPRALVLITNDAWFGTFSGPYQHLTQARMRALELGLPMIRVANTGITAMIDARGVITESLPLGATAYSDAALPAALAPTFYAQVGPWPTVLIWLLWGVLVAIGLRRKGVDTPGAG